MPRVCLSSRLLIVNGITIGVTVSVIVNLSGRRPRINDDKPGGVAMVTVVKRVAHTGEVRANQGRAAEI